MNKIPANEEMKVLELLVSPELGREANQIFRKLDWSHLNQLKSLSLFADLTAADRIESEIIGKEVTFEHAATLPLQCEIEPLLFKRLSSATKFSNQQMSHTSLLEFCTAAFGVHSEGVESRRPYASAGGLYPVSVFAIPMTISGQAAEPGLYFLPNSQTFQKLPSPLWSQKEITLCYGDIPGGLCIAIVYMINVQRSIAKYRLRGIKHALIEVGEMVQSATFTAQRLGLDQRCWSAHNESLIKSFLGLQPNLYEVGMVQLIGQRSVE